MTTETIAGMTSDAGGVHLTLSNGASLTLSAAQYAQWRDAVAARSKTVHPLETIGGNCGFSTITFVPIGNRQGQMGTGFTVTSPAISYNWEVSFIDNFGASAQQFSGGLALRTSWATGFTFTGGGGPTRATVETGVSYALLDTGGVCYSAGPSESAIIT